MCNSRCAHNGHVRLGTVLRQDGPHQAHLGRRHRHCDRCRQVCARLQYPLCTIADKLCSCPTCVTATSLDLSVAAFLKLGTSDEGTFPIVWAFLD